MHRVPGGWSLIPQAAIAADSPWMVMASKGAVAGLSAALCACVMECPTNTGQKRQGFDQRDQSPEGETCFISCLLFKNVNATIRICICK